MKRLMGIILGLAAMIASPHAWAEFGVPFNSFGTSFNSFGQSNVTANWTAQQQALSAIGNAYTNLAQNPTDPNAIAAFQAAESQYQAAQAQYTSQLGQPSPFGVQVTPPPPPIELCGHHHRHICAAGETPTNILINETNLAGGSQFGYTYPGAIPSYAGYPGYGYPPSYTGYPGYAPGYTGYANPFGQTGAGVSTITAGPGSNGIINGVNTCIPGEFCASTTANPFNQIGTWTNPSLGSTINGGTVITAGSQIANPLNEPVGSFGTGSSTISTLPVVSH